MNICVFGAASDLIDDKYKEAAFALGKAGHTLIFGAGGEGMMGAVARGFHAGNGFVVGIVPEFFKDQDYEALYRKNDELIYTKDIAERINLMEERSDAFIAVPGGIGTYEEFFKIFVSKGLRVHDKPLVLFNVDGFFDELVDMIHSGIEKKFIAAANLEKFRIYDAGEMDELIKYLNTGG